MRVVIDEHQGSLRLRLLDADDFSAFAVVLADDVDPARADQEVPEVRFDGSNHAWVDPGWLRDAGAYRTGPRAENLARMLRYAETKGWLHPASGEVAAHVVRQPACALGTSP
ncbi:MULTISPECIES: hypothetical protein [Prauserella]|uniref:hypothetical protein n=1 Tax=Prauserella TaxID=142577 RepID=UPI000D8FCA07|nr:MULTISPECIES: hypothetical protein [Prauserella]PXY23135.1 hypothetical protein BAY59_25835 [Prauserella coralliicola]